MADAVQILIDRLRPQLVSLVEAYGLTDNILTSAIGNSYGDIYETQLEWTRNSRLNQREVIVGFEENLMPVIRGKL